MRRSMPLIRSRCRVGLGSVASMPPTSTMLTGHWARSETRVVAWNGAYFATLPSEVAAARAAPGPTAWMHVFRACEAVAEQAQLGPELRLAGGGRQCAEAADPEAGGGVARDRGERGALRARLGRVRSGCLTGGDRGPAVGGARRQAQALDRHRGCRAVAEQSPEDGGVLGRDVVPRQAAEPHDDERLARLRLRRGRHGDGGAPGIGERESSHQRQEQDDERLDGVAADHGGQTTNRACRPTARSRAGTDGAARHPRGYPCRSWTPRR